MSTYLYGAFDRMLLSCHVRVNRHSRLRTSGCGFEFCFCRLNFRYGACEEFLDIQATIECRFTLKLVRHNIITYSYVDDGWKPSYTCSHCKRKNFPKVDALLSKYSKCEIAKAKREREFFFGKMNNSSIFRWFFRWHFVYALTIEKSDATRSNSLKPSDLFRFKC